MLFDILNAIQSELKFNYTLVKSKDEKYGKLVQSKQWNGQIGLVQREEIDFSIMDLTVLLERSEVQSIYRQTLVKTLYKLQVNNF